MVERYEIGFVVYNGLWALTKEGRAREVVEDDVNVNWEEFPKEALSNIFLHAASSVAELCNFSLVSTFWHVAAHDTNQKLWKKLYELEFNEIAYFKRGVEIDWKQLFRERVRIRNVSKYDTIRNTSPSQRDLKIRIGVSFFDTHIFNCALFSGKWYYELIMPETNFDAIQVGVTTVLARPFYHVNNEFCGVGDDDFSWSYDGIRGQKFHGNTIGNNEYWKQDFKWNSGDCIRVCMNIDDGELKFLFNHNDLGTVYNFPTHHRITDYENDGSLQDPILPYYPAVTCQQSQYGGDINPQIIIQRAKMRYGPPEGYTSLGEKMEEKQFVDKISMTHIPTGVTGVIISNQMKKFIDEMKSKGYIVVPPPIENVNVDAGELAQRNQNKTTTTNTSYNNFDFDNYYD